MQELDSQMGKSKKIGDRMMEFALRSLLSESNGAIHSEELSPYFERYIQYFFAFYFYFASFFFLHVTI